MQKLQLDEALSIASDDSLTSLLSLDIALGKLAEEDPDAARLVEMRFFAGLSSKEIAEVLGVTERTVRRQWSYARAWLYRELNGDEHRDGLK